MPKKENENKVYKMWYAGTIKDIKLSVEEALRYYESKKMKIISIEVSKSDSEKGFTIKDISVKPKREILKNHIYLEMEKENVETKSK